MKENTEFIDSLPYFAQNIKSSGKKETEQTKFKQKISNQRKLDLEALGLKTVHVELMSTFHRHSKEL